MKLRFLIDENLSPRLKVALNRRYPEIDVIRIGDDGAPPRSTSDPDILRYLQAEQRTLVTDNRHSMPTHSANHFAAGGHHWGIFEVAQSSAFGSLIDLLALYWEASEAEEWLNCLEWITP